MAKRREEISSSGAGRVRIGGRIRGIRKRRCAWRGSKSLVVARKVRLLKATARKAEKRDR